MNHKELREKVNSTLKDKALVSLSPDRERRITSGLSSGSLMLNLALSGNPLVGYVWGRIAEIYGAESGGKTTLALHAIKEAQHIEDMTGAFLPCLFVDAEHSLDVSYAADLGIDMDRLTVTQPGCAEEALSATEAAIKEGFKVVVVDSVAALTPKAEVDGDMGEAHVGLHARLMSQACRKLSPLVAKQKAVLIFINQIRMKIGVMFGNPETRPGGQALKYYATYVIEVRAPRSGKKEGKTLMGYGDVEDTVELATKVRAQVKKNKVFPPHRKAEFVIEYGMGIDRIKDVVAFLEYSEAFQPPETGKTKTPSIYIPSAGKRYTPKGLAGALTDPDVVADVFQIIKEREETRDINS